ncbi:MAG: uracil-DNA glycosylase [Acidobacteria bacterium]|nr:uracil-DNA glycosylase [Acidobacteriota bacterium]
MTISRELKGWLRYYRDIGFTHVYSRHLSTIVPTECSAPIIEENPFELLVQNSPEMTKTVSFNSSAVSAAGGVFTSTIDRETLDAIRGELGEDCRRCKLHKGRKTIVFGSGNPKAEVVFVGEGPGADEDQQGLPFVGRAGQLLTDMIEKGMKLQRADVYICNIVKCRPPDNRKPEKDEVAACRVFVERQLNAIRPKVICALGATAAETLLGVRQSMASLRGKAYEFHGIPLIVTYHPAFLLRDPTRKRDTWTDLKLVLGYLQH